MKQRWIVIALVVVLLGGVVALLGPRRVFRAGLRRVERQWLIMKGNLVDVGGHRLHVKRHGKGSPAVVMETGLCQPFTTWGKVTHEVARFTHVVIYNRAYLGHSDPVPPPRTGQQIVDELHTLLKKIRTPGPYVLVGHSFGGLNVRLYASLYPDDVVGMVLIDASHDQEVPRIVDLIPPEDARDFLETHMGKNCEHVDILASGNQIRKAKSLPDIPLIVITARKASWPRNWPLEQLEVLRFGMQRDLVRLVPHGIHIIAEESGHFIQLDQPKLVIKAIRRIVEEIRGVSPNMLHSDESKN